METTVLQAKNHLSELLRKAEAGEEVLIRRGRRGRLFRIVPVADAPARTLVPNPKWKGAIAYRDEDIWASEWKEDA
jgi:prevent-host-death family protein